MLPLRVRVVFFLLPIAFMQCGKDSPSSSKSSDSPIDESVSYSTSAFARVKADVERLEKQISRSPNDARLHVELGRVLLNGGIQHRGTSELERGLELDPTAAIGSVLLARAKLTLGDLEAASQVIARGIQHGENADLRAIEAEILLRRDPNERAEAKRLLSLALDIDPENADALYQLGVVSLREGLNEDAVRCLRKVTQLTPAHLGAHFNLARALRNLGREQEAQAVAVTHKRIAILETLGQLADIEAVEAFAGVAQVLLDGGNSSGALSELERGIARHPSAAVLRVKKALALIQTDRIDQGRQEFEQGIRQLPEDAMLANQYAWYLATTNGASDEDRKRAVRLADKAVGLTKRKDPNMLDTLAQARAAAGDVKGALAAIEEALKLRPGEPALLKRKQELAVRGEQQR